MEKIISMLPKEKAEHIYKKVYAELYALTDLRPRVAKKISILIIDELIDQPQPYKDAYREMGFPVDDYNELVKQEINKL